MNIALTKIYAVASANFCVRSSFVRPLALGCVLACAVPAVLARPDRDHDGQRAQAAPAAQQTPRELPRGERLQPLQAPQPRQYEVGRSDQQAFDTRVFDARAEEQRRQIQMQQEQAIHNAEAGRRSGRLTPDERRDLRRQINEAGMDLYPNTPRR